MVLILWKILVISKIAIIPYQNYDIKIVFSLKNMYYKK